MLARRNRKLPSKRHLPSKLLQSQQHRSPNEPNQNHAKNLHPTEPTLEQMRMAGALAAERLNNPNPSQAKKSGQSDSEAASTPRPAVPETPRPAKRKPRSEQTNTSHRTSSRAAKPDTAGAVRPTFMESGRSEPSATPLSKGQTPAP